MKCDSKKNLFTVSHKASAFTLIEVMAAVLILSLITSSVLTIMNRCISATIDSRKKMLAFELARENMETLLSASSMREKNEFGVSHLDPEIEWETIIETTSVSGSNKLYLQAVCSATYIDTEGESQKIEFTHWITKLSAKHIAMIKNRDKLELEHFDRIEYDKFLQFLRKEILSYLGTSRQDASEYRDLLKELNDEKSEFIEKTRRFDDDAYDEFIESQTDQETDFLVPDYLTFEEYDLFREIATKKFEAERSGQSGDSSATDKDGLDSDSDEDKNTSDPDKESITPEKEPATPEKKLPPWFKDLPPEKQKIFRSFLEM